MFKEGELRESRNAGKQGAPGTILGAMDHTYLKICCCLCAFLEWNPFHRSLRCDKRVMLGLVKHNQCYVVLWTSSGERKTHFCGNWPSWIKNKKAHHPIHWRKIIWYMFVSSCQKATCNWVITTCNWVKFDHNYLLNSEVRTAIAFKEEGRYS